MCRIHPVSVVLGTLLIAPGAWPAEADAPTFCATAEQAEAVARAYEQSPPPPPFMLASRLAMPEAVVASALPSTRGAGTSATEFFKVWESLRAWDDAVTLVLKGGQVFEIHGAIHGGEPSKVSRNYNLDEKGAGFSGHLRPDLMSAIYVIEQAGREGPVRAVAFYDQKGDSAFWVVVPPEGASARNISQFEATRELIRSLPRACRPAVAEKSK